MSLIGPTINAAGIILGCCLALVFKKKISPQYQLTLKIGLGVATVFLGLKLAVTSFHGSIGQIAKQFAIVILAMIIGNLLGKLLHFQKTSNALGRYSARVLSRPPKGRDRGNSGFLVTTILYCIAPLAFFASVQEGLNEGWAHLFVVKAIMDGAAAVAFASMFGWSAILSVIPVLAFQGVLIRATQLLVPFLQNHPAPLIDSINITNGILIACVALVMLQVKRIAVTDYLPSLAVAPLLMNWLW